METIIRMRPSELTPDFIERIKILFKNENENEIAISPVNDFGLTLKESRTEYVNRVNKAIAELESKNGTVTLSASKFETLTNDLMNK